MSRIRGAVEIGWWEATAAILGARDERRHGRIPWPAPDYGRFAINARLPGITTVCDRRFVTGAVHRRKIARWCHPTELIL